MKSLLLSFFVFSICQGVAEAGSHEVISEDATSDRYCENLRIAELELTESEIIHYRRFGLASSPITIAGEVFYLIHPRISERCRDRFMAGRLLHQISKGEISDEGRLYAQEGEVFVIRLIESLWESGSISQSDLNHEKELLIVYGDFSLEGRSRLLEVALRVDGVSQPVIFALWTLPRSVTADFISIVLTEFGQTMRGKDKLLLGLTLLRLGCPSSAMIRVEELIDETELSTQQRVKVDGIVRRIANSDDVAYMDLLNLGFGWDD